MSPYLFILSAEILADAIGKKQTVKGIGINVIDFKLSQYNNILKLQRKIEKIRSILDRMLEISQTYIIRENSSFEEPGYISVSLHILTSAN